jgi:hypothetical protein
MNANDGYHLVITPSRTNTSLAGRYQITDKNSGLALDTLNAGTAQGTSVVQATPTTGTDENWTLAAAGNGLYKIANHNSGLLLGVNNMSTSPRRPGPAVGGQRHRRPPVEADLPVSQLPRPVSRARASRKSPVRKDCSPAVVA